ncbi:uncharacterized protein LOC117646438 [Thrips palmi]|uniref:Uncharacterized protein LOC117646438 n=1 Tax=Thrips palmi TaxID=161013 RepID=A0A6P8Z8G2_THRPL|nr:uncharacterized protein LOC117646438 [Thrips palmi]
MSDDSTDKNVEEPSEELPHTSKLLSGSSLLQIHVSTGKSLPKDGVKDFSPTNSWMEKKQIQCALDERKELLDEERVDKWSCLAGAVWNHKKKLAEVTRRAGKHFQTLGFVKEGTLYLYPEEALYMLETNSLELDFGGVSVSIQQGYSLLLGPSTGCDLNEYRTYSHLMRQGYRLLRFTNQIVHTRYERAIRLDQHAPVKRNHPGQTGKDKKSRSDTPRKIETMKVENHDTSAVEPVNNLSLLNREDTPCASEESAIYGEVSRTAVMNEGEELEQLQPTNHKEDSTPSLMNNSPQKICENSKDPNVIESTNNDKHDETWDESGNQEPTADAADQSAVDKGEERQDAEISDNGEKSEQSQQPDKANSSADGLRTKAYGIAETLLSMGSALVRNRPTEENSSGDNTNTPEILAATLQSEIMKILGAQLDSGVSEEALATVASSAADTILSHVSNSGNEISAKISGHENILESDKTDYDEIQSPKENSVSEAADSRCEDSLTMETFADPSLSINSTNVGPVCTDSNDSNSDMVCLSIDADGNENGAHFQHLNDQNTDSNDSGSIMVCSSNDNAEIGKEAGSQQLKRPATSDETDQLSVCKKAKVVDEEDIEILEYVPEKKQVELVDLSDESSMDTSNDSKVNEAHSNSIEVIDVGDSSSNGSSELTSSDSNDSSVILEEKTSSNQGYSWNIERRKILEIIPNMYNLPEMTVKPPTADLLPKNVQPQRSLYHINRQRLVEDGREDGVDSSHSLSVQEDRFGNSNVPSSDTLSPNFMNQGPQVPFAAHGGMPQQFWPTQSGIPISPVEAVQAVARMVLPMLGLPPNVFPPEQMGMWVPNNAWFPHRPWGPGPGLGPRRAGPWRPRPGPPRGVGVGMGMGPRFNQHASRGNNFQRSRPRPYAHRRFARRYPHRGGAGGSSQIWQLSPHARRGGGGGGSSQNWQHSPHAQGQTLLPTDNFPMNQVIPLQSTSRPLENVSEKTAGPSSWEQVKSKKPRLRGMGKRYFNPPNNSKYKHMRTLSDKSQIEGQMSDSSSDDANSPNIKTESDSSDDNSTSEDMERNENNSSMDNTDESCSSPSEVKPLLSPRECKDFESVFKSVQVIKEADTPSLVSTTYERQFKPQFDLFLPSKPFRKGNPPVPDFHLCIMRASDAVPAPGEIRVLMEALGDSVPVMFAVVSPDAISFFQFCDVSLPSVTGSC